MKDLFHLTGRAWSFITNSSKGFTFKFDDRIETFTENAQHQLQGKGQLGYEITDIEGCFPNMPKEVIKHALRDTLQKITQEYGYDVVMI